MQAPEAKETKIFTRPPSEKPAVARSPAAWVLSLALAFAVGALGGVSSALAEGVIATIDLSEQRMRVMIDGRFVYEWPVSTGRPGYRTPQGNFHPIRLERVWYSTKYDWAPMPNSIFFHGGYAIHGTVEIATLGRPVSHGCIRLHPANASTLFDLALIRGKADFLIRIVP